MQVKKEVKELERAFGTGPEVRLPGKIAAMVRDYNGGEAEMATIMIYGESHRVQIAKNMLLEAVENREQKQKQRQKVCHCSDFRLPLNKPSSSSAKRHFNFYRSMTRRRRRNDETDKYISCGMLVTMRCSKFQLEHRSPN